MLKYQGYSGIVEYDSDAKIFTGEVIGIRSVVTFQGRTPEELEASFSESIDLYLEMCKEDGVQPEKPYSGRFNVRIPPDTPGDCVKSCCGAEKSERSGRGGAP